MNISINTRRGIDYIKLNNYCLREFRTTFKKKAEQIVNQLVDKILEQETEREKIEKGM